MYEVDDGHRGVRRLAYSLAHARVIATALSAGGTAVIYKDEDPKFLVVYRLGRLVRKERKK
jgi:hypothetical protein